MATEEEKYLHRVRKLIKVNSGVKKEFTREQICTFFTFDIWRSNKKDDYGVLFWELVVRRANYMYWCRELLSESSLLISLPRMMELFPYDDEWNERKFTRKFFEYLRENEIRYLIKLHGFTVTHEEIKDTIKIITKEEKRHIHDDETYWEKMRTLKERALFVWKCAVISRAQYYEKTIGIESIEQKYQEIKARLPIGLSFSRKGIYSGICICRALTDNKIPPRSFRDIKLTLERAACLDLSYMTREEAKFTAIFEGYLKPDDFDQPGGKFSIQIKIETSPFTELLIKKIEHEYSKDEDEYWYDLLDLFRGDEDDIPESVIFCQNSSGGNFTDYFYPRASNNPDDHHRFLKDFMSDKDDPHHRRLKKIFFRSVENIGFEKYKKNFLLIKNIIHAIPGGTDYEEAERKFDKQKVELGKKEPK